MTVAASMNNTVQEKRPLTANKGRKSHNNISSATKTLSTPSTVETDWNSLFKGITEDLGRLDIIYPCY